MYPIKGIESGGKPDAIAAPLEYPIKGIESIRIRNYYTSDIILEYPIKGIERTLFASAV